MSNRIKNIILVCSLIFNLTLVGFWGYNCLSRCSKAPVTHHRKPKFGHHEQKIRALREEMIQERKGFFLMLRDGNIEEEAILPKIDAIIEKQTNMEREIAANLIELRKSMTDEEAMEFFNKINQRRQKGRR